jgi:hypothetical protein
VAFVLIVSFSNAHIHSLCTTHPLWGHCVMVSGLRKLQSAAYGRVGQNFGGTRFEEKSFVRPPNQWLQPSNLLPGTSKGNCSPSWARHMENCTLLLGLESSKPAPTDQQNHQPPRSSRSRCESTGAESSLKSRDHGRGFAHP